MPPKGRPKQAYSASARPSKRPASPSATSPSPAKRIKRESDAEASASQVAPATHGIGTRSKSGIKVGRRFGKAARQPTVHDFLDREAYSDDGPQHENTGADYDVEVSDGETIESSPAPEERLELDALVELCATQHELLTEFMTNISEAEELADVVEDNLTSEEAIEWADSGDSEEVTSYPTKRKPGQPTNVAASTTDEERQRLALDKLVGDNPALLQYILSLQKRATTSTAAENVIPAAKKPAKSPAVTVQTQLPVDARFDGQTSVLNSALWAPVLRKAYRELEPPPRIVKFAGRVEGAQPTPRSFQKWTACTDHLAFFLKVLAFKSNAHYFNIARGKCSDLHIVDTLNSTKPMRYFARKGSNVPALFVTLVEVVKSNLVRAVKINSQNTDGWLDKKSLVAECFQQEFELLICWLGYVVKSSNVTIPCWSNKEDASGLTFQTRLARSDGPTAVRAGQRSALYEPGATALSTSKISLQLYADRPLPVIDSSSDEFDLNAPFSDFKQSPSMQTEPEPGSIGVVFYTITDAGPQTAIDFNFQAFAYLAGAHEAAATE